MKKFISLGFLVFLAGCTHLEVQNMTPSAIPVNASGVYRLSLKTDVYSGDVARDSVRPAVIIDGQSHAMELLGDCQFGYDYRMPRNRNSATYYFDVNYALQGDRGLHHHSKKSEIYELQLANRYAMGLDSERATPGSTITILGRGFDEKDQVTVDGFTAQTHYLSSTTLQFVMPALPAKKSYPVRIADSSGESIPAGNILLDGGRIRVTPSNIEITEDGSAEITLILSAPAPDSGLEIDVETDIPAALSMPRIFVRPGRTSATIAINGIHEARGHLYFSAPGFRDRTVNISVTR